MARLTADGDVSRAGWSQSSLEFVGFIVLGTVVLALKAAVLVNGSNSPALRNLPVWLLPLLIVGYWIIGWRQNRQARAESRQRFADNLYFLGFIFTMGSLIATFLPAAVADALEINPRDIYSAFGTALISTALGLIFRVVVMQTAPSDDESALQIEEDLTRLTARLADEARAIGDTLAAARQGLAAQHEATVGAVLDGIAPRLAALVAAFGKATLEATTILGKQAETTRQQADRLQQKVEARTTDITEAAQLLAGAREQVGGTLERLTVPVADLTRQLADAGAAVAETVSRLRGDVAGLTESLRRASDSGQQLTTALGGLETRTEAHGGRIDTAIGALTETIDGGAGRLDSSIAGAADRVAVALSAVEQRAARATGDAAGFQAAIAEAMAAFTRAVDSFAADLDRVRVGAAISPPPAAPPIDARGSEERPGAFAFRPPAV